jgi:peptidoglycan/LPS O-acetylase OafA/YrhL
MAVETTARIRELDGWRGVSILLVVFVHTMVYVFPHLIQTSRVAYHFTRFAGEYSVRIFFLISGFVIARLFVQEEACTGSISIRGFYARRVLRIIPAYYLLISVTCLLGWLGWTPVDRHTLLQSIFFLRDFKSNDVNWFLAHSWTLAVEEQFYLMFPLFWLFSSPRRRPLILLATLAVFLIWSVLAEWGIFAAIFAPSILVGFACINIGILLAVFEERVRRFTAAMPAWFALLVAGIVFIGVVPHGRFGDSLRGLYEPFGLAFILMYTVSQKSWVSSALKSRAIQWIGMTSYSAYLWQQIFTGRTASYGDPGIARIFHFSLPLLFVVAAISFYWIERPCIRLGRRLSARIPIRPRPQSSSLRG